MSTQEWFYLMAVVGGLLISLPLVRMLAIRTGASAEVSRKTVHVCMGLACLCFPWIFQSPLAVWILAFISSGLLFIMRCIPGLRYGIGCTLHGVNRLSFGEILFAPAIATVFHMEQVGLDAVPLVMLLSFLVGAVIAFLGSNILADFGASIYVVELVSISFLREFAVLLTAIILAGRTASAFTAQIGSMVSREEVDAIRTLGLDPVELLVIPRLLALVVMLPLLTFIAMLAGLLGGMFVGMTSLDIPVQAYYGRLQETVELRHFLVGMAKAPIFAMVIGLIGCLEGLQVTGTAQSVGERTTSSVVQSISLVIVLDAFAAIWFMQVGW